MDAFVPSLGRPRGRWLRLRAGFVCLRDLVASSRGSAAQADAGLYELARAWSSIDVASEVIGGKDFRLR